MANTKRMKQRIWILFGFAILIFLGSFYEPEPQRNQISPAGSVEQLFEQRQSDVQIEVAGTVTRLLADDNKGSRHQRFIIELASGQTLLIVHNIDLAPRINEIKEGDDVRVYGEYIWNDKGGLIHWTHHDPANRHPHGWIRHQGRLYQ
ncbi:MULTISPECIES: DUF3465 domain-containing protein [unclassified Methylophaga]|jgi:hypothetical protein|uniref:DUF3465 domain-containing protein n=1 Tax=unclassified Methylophaga TaxID=2629249 RepID=UPI000C9108DA|nr:MULTISPECIES: DUF3465 domain-containing protein [unclassified Methylophaga]MAK66908.1 DNA-binding protein [Methylophaga sp.]MAY17944.1 DNA-binding protein [Methylophaga sp.]HAO25161.1 DNA-binding protein [Methylophaga sp.]|tara:strand:+ start:7004 stop:7447 length:444 start_codon:yes stop_codon:yes gene_type:complete